MAVAPLLGLFLGIIAVVSLALSRHRWLRMIGIGLLLLLAVGGLVLTLGLVALAASTPRSDGLARFGLAFLSIPSGLLTWLALRFFIICRRLDPHASPHPSGVAGLFALLGRLLGRAP